MAAMCANSTELSSRTHITPLSTDLPILTGIVTPSAAGNASEAFVPCPRHLKQGEVLPDTYAAGNCAIAASSMGFTASMDG